MFRKLFETKLSLRQVLLVAAVIAAFLGINWVGHHIMVSSSTQTTEYYSYMSLMSPLSDDSQWSSGIIRDDEWYTAESGWEFDYTLGYTLDHLNWTILVDIDLEYYEADGDWVMHPYTNLDANFGYVTTEIRDYLHR